MLASTSTIVSSKLAYVDDIAAGADTLEELFELLKALIECFDLRPSRYSSQGQQIDLWDA
jgi:hypothetical protein